MATNRVKKPIENGTAKVPVFMQMEATECGAACLAMVLAYYGRWITLEKARMDCGISRDGSNAGNILKAARSYGLEAQGYTCEPEDLLTEGQFPAIAHWDFDHFVVIKGFKKGRAYINDPALGEYSISMEAFDKHFTGAILMFEPAEEFEPGGKQVSMISYATNKLKENKKALAFIIVTAIIFSLFGIASPFFSEIFVDSILSGDKPEWITPFLIILGVFSAVQIVVGWIEAIKRSSLEGMLDAKGASDYFKKILYLPVEFFSQRSAGDIRMRMDCASGISSTLVGTIGPLVINTGMLVFYLVVMFRNNWILSLIGIASIIINTGISIIISKRRINYTRVSMRDRAKLASSTDTALDLIETIKATGAETGMFQKWSGYQAKIQALDVEVMDQNYFLEELPEIVSIITDVAILTVGVVCIIKGYYTAGMLMSFQGFLDGFLGPAMDFVEAGQVVQEMRTDMERVNDVMEYPSEDIFLDDYAYYDEEMSKLKGNISIKNVSFGYSRLAEPVIKDFNLEIKTGMQVAIVGGTGCGKSTISKLISGLYKPWEGEILFDGKPMSEIKRSVFKSSISVVDQNFVLFEDSVSDNIKFWDDTIEDFEVILAARDASIHEDIIERPGGYKYIIKQGGSNFSGGQCQRIAIARTLAQDPTIIVLDEATSALDAMTENEVVSSIRARGCTCIVIAHRLSTIRDSDIIVVLDNGEIVGMGTHEELIDSNEVYKKLVASE